MSLRSFGGLWHQNWAKHYNRTVDDIDDDDDAVLDDWNFLFKIMLIMILSLYSVTA